MALKTRPGRWSRRMSQAALARAWLRAGLVSLVVASACPGDDRPGYDPTRLLPGLRTIAAAAQPVAGPAPDASDAASLPPAIEGRAGEGPAPEPPGLPPRPVPQVLDRPIE